jgi:hypothetical protein
LLSFKNNSETGKVDTWKIKVFYGVQTLAVESYVTLKDDLILIFISLLIKTLSKFVSIEYK